MKARTLPAWAAALLLLPVVLGSTPSSSYATPPATPDYTFSIREADAEGTTHLAPDYQPPLLGPEYTSNPPTYGPDDTYVQDEVIIRFRPEVPAAQQNALMQAHGMRFGRRIYGEKAFVAKVPPHAALTVANALRHNPMLDVVEVNRIIKLAADPYDPNDPIAPQQEHLGTSTLQQINAREGWGYGHGLNQVSLVAFIDSAIDHNHPDISAKYNPANWICFINDCSYGRVEHGTFVAGLATASTDNNIGIAGTGFSAWPMSLGFRGVDDEEKNPTASYVVSAINWASDHGASVINLSLSTVDDLQLLRAAVDRAYARGITIVAAAGNFEYDVPFYPAAFGQLPFDPDYNPKLVIAVVGTKSGYRQEYSNYGNWVDFGAPSIQDDGEGLYSTIPITYTGRPYVRAAGAGTSYSTPQVAGLASLLTSLGYRNDQVHDFIRQGATDLPCDPGVTPCPPGFDKYTGWGRINMGRSMELAHRTSPGMAVVPDKGYPGVQWFNFQGSGFDPDADGVRVCWTPPGGFPSCAPGLQTIDSYGVAGLGVQVSANASYGIWTASMCEENGQQVSCTTGAFTVLVDSE